MTKTPRAALRASLVLLACSTALPAFASDPAPDEDILITAQRQKATIERAPNTSASVDAATIATTVNAMNVEDTLKYLPSLIVRKRHIGDTQAPLATRTSGLGASARSLIYADGALLSSLIGNNNTSASPRWSAVAPQEVARIDVLYGPFSAAYPGNSIGAVVNITTRLPDELEASASAGVTVQSYDLYGRKGIYPAYQIGLTAGDRFGPLAVFASYDHVTSKSQPLAYVTATTVTSGNPNANVVAGAIPDVNRTGGSIRVLGASALENQGQDRLKLKAALDLGGGIRLTYIGGLFLNHTNASVDSFLTSQTTGLPVYAGTVTLEGRPYTIAASAFSNGRYDTRQRHWWHSLSLGGSGGQFDWQMIGTRYRFSFDEQRTPTGALPGAFAGGAGNIVRLDGTGWDTFDAKAAWRGGDHVLSFGGHWDRYAIASNRFTTSDWIAGNAGALNQQSLGKTHTIALWVQDAWTIVPSLTLTVGGRYEWWRAYDGVNYSLSPVLSVAQPRRSANRFSPKASLGWAPAKGWNVQLSFGQAWRFPTVGELYQAVTTGPTLTSPNPNLRPERAQSEELAIEHRDKNGSIRLSLFNEIVTDALISQTGTIVTPTDRFSVSFVQNVDRTRARGVELAVVRTDLLPRVNVSGSVTWADATTRADAAFPAAIGKLLPTVPRWKATAVATWQPVDGVSLTAAARYASRMYGQLDNVDIVGNTYQGFYKYLVVDLRAQFVVAKHYTFGVGVDNVNNDKYFLFHPFPQRAFHIDLSVKL